MLFLNSTQRMKHYPVSMLKSRRCTFSSFSLTVACRFQVYSVAGWGGAESAGSVVYVGVVCVLAVTL